MIPNVQSVPATMDQEEVAHRMRQSRYLALPVVDGDSRLIGLITLDDVVDVIQDEATEDIQRMAGAGAEERLSSPWQLSFTKRIGWLQVNLATAFLAGAVVNAFGSTITRFAVLAIYMPIVSGMGGNAAAQAMSVSIRGISGGKHSGEGGKIIDHVLPRSDRGISYRDGNWTDHRDYRVVVAIQARVGAGRHRCDGAGHHADPGLHQRGRDSVCHAQTRV